MPTNYTEKDAAANPPKANAYPAPEESHLGDVRVTSAAFDKKHPSIVKFLTGGGNHNTRPARAVMPAYPHAMHTGGPVMEDGVYRLQAGEHVLTASEAAKARKHALMVSGMKSLAKSGKSSSKKTKE